MSRELKLWPLLPCPACGDAMPGVERVGRAFTVECGCGVTGQYKASPEEAVIAWNALPRRADIEMTDAELEAEIRHILALATEEEELEARRAKHPNPGQSGKNSRYIAGVNPAVIQRIMNAMLLRLSEKSKP